jgi:hypothetical protein
VRKLVAGGRKVLLALFVTIGGLIAIYVTLVVLGSGAVSDLRDMNIPGAVNDVKGIFESGTTPPGRIEICEDAYEGPFTGYPLHCETDIGTHPIQPLPRLWCITTLSGVKDTLILVEVFFGPTLVVARSLDSHHNNKATAYTEITPAMVGSPQKQLPAGRYSCRFAAGGTVRARSVTVVQPGSFRLTVWHGGYSAVPPIPSHPSPRTNP